MVSKYTALVGCDPITGELSPSVLIGGLTVEEARTAIKQISGYRARTISGNETIDAVEAGTWALDLTGDTNLTISGGNGSTVVLNLLCDGHTLNVVDGADGVGPFNADGLIALNRARDKWYGGGGNSGPAVVTPTAPTFTDNLTDGGGTYTIPTKNGVVYKVGGVVKVAGDYAVSGASATTVTVTAEISDVDKYEIATGATVSWTHTFAKAKYTFVAEHDFATDTDSTAPTGLTLTNGAAITIGGKAAIQAGRFGLFALSTPNQIATPAVCNMYATVSLPKSRRSIPGALFVGTDAQTAVSLKAWDGVKSIADISVKADGGLVFSGWQLNTWEVVPDSGAEAWTSISANAWTSTTTITNGVVPAMALDWDAPNRTSTFYLGGVKIGAIRSTDAPTNWNVGGVMVGLLAFNGDKASVQRPQIWSIA